MVSLRREWIARSVLVLIIAGLPLLVLGYQYVLRPRLAATRVIDITASLPEAGGFQPASIDVQAGETVTLRFTSTDVTHGIAIGPGLGVNLGAVDPGHVKEVALSFDHPGTYTFYCTTWCSVNHWRMRGVIDVRSDAVEVTPQRDPVIEALATAGVDIDASLHTDQPTRYPAAAAESAVRGEELMSTLRVPNELRDKDWQRTHTPAQAVVILSALNDGLTEAQAVDAIAALWSDNLSVTDSARQFYRQNCAACHGEQGAGDGFMAGKTAVSPANFAAPTYMFMMRGDVLYAKIRRGGMGTDMPNFGTVFTPEETWALVDYLWSLSLRGSTRVPVAAQTSSPSS